MNRFNGIGTEYYGKKDYKEEDGSYVTTKWFVLFLLPIYPIKSYRIRKIQGSDIHQNYIVIFSQSQSFEIIEEIDIGKNISQIIKTYIKGWGITFFVFFLLYIFTKNLE